jgi:hypothetical protein
MKRDTQRLILAVTAFLIALALVPVSPLNAQVISGDLVGTVLDKTGATVPNASVEATNVETGVKYPTRANDVGEYHISNLPVGVYNVTASLPNFAVTTVSGYRVDLNKISTLHITLEIKGAVTSIEVSGQVAALDTTTAQVQSTFEGKELADLPDVSTGSGVLNLSLLSSGVATSGGVGVGMGPSVGGQRPRNNNFEIEGVDNNNKGVTGALVSIPNDAVAEFSILQNQFSPEFGHSSGGQFNTVVRSGTNSFHGLAYIYNQNRDYDALDTFNAAQGLGSGPDCAANGGSFCSAPGPRFDSNRIGGQVGGPILKNKLFFFVNYEYDPVGTAGGAAGACAPTADSYARINAATGLSSTNVAIFEKYVPAGTISDDVSGCSPIPWFNFDSKVGCTHDTCLDASGISLVAPSFVNGKFITSSLDWNISTSDQVRGRYIYNSVIGVDNLATLPVFYTPQPNKFHLVTINEYHTFTPTLTNELRFGYNRFAQSFVAGDFSFPGLDVFPNLQFTDLNNLNIGPDGGAPQGTVQNLYQLTEALTWTKGNHTLKFGVEGRKAIAPQNFTQRSRGDYEYDTTLEYFQDQIPTSVAERSNGNTVYYGDQSAIYWYVNDNWRIRPNVTLNLGLRYEYTTSPYSERLQALNSGADEPGLITFGAPQWSKNNFAPRIGIAYSPGSSGRTSIRAGFGEAFDTLFDNLGLLTVPPQLGATNDCAPNFGTYPCIQGNFLGAGGILPGAGGINDFTLDNPICEGFTTAVACQRHFTSADLPNLQKMPKSIDWTLGIQHTFWTDYTIEVRYLGTRGIHLPAQIQLNKQSKVSATTFLPTFFSQPDQATLNALPLDLAAIQLTPAVIPAYGNAGFDSNITSYQPWASSTYNGLAAQLTRRFSKGLQGVLAYTYSHNIDDATAEVFSTVLAPRRAQDSRDLSADRANSILDHRHRLTLTVIYDEPFFKNGNALLKNTLGNWELAPIYTYQSGQWMTAQSTIDSNLNGDSAPDRTVFDPSGAKSQSSVVSPLCNSTVATCPTTLAAALKNPAGVVGYLAQPNQNGQIGQYVQAGYGALANVGRNTLQLDPINDLDLTAIKRSTITERFKVEFQAQFFNIFNHPQYIGGLINDVAPIGFTGPERSVLTPGSAVFNNPTQNFASNARTLQLALKIYF